MQTPSEPTTSPPQPDIEATLLLGPTASGKTPLGEHLARNRLWGRRCLHLDFGSCLRNAAAGLDPNNLSETDRHVIENSLRSGALLEEEHASIAEKILTGFLTRCGAGGDDRVILNGLPRHIGQTRLVDRILHVTAVVCLRCGARTVRERIATNAGGDRLGRVDDQTDDIARKLDLFAQRTEPLSDHYRHRGADIIDIDVRTDTTARDIRNILDRR